MTLARHCSDPRTCYGVQARWGNSAPVHTSRRRLISGVCMLVSCSLWLPLLHIVIATVGHDHGVIADGNDDRDGDVEDPHSG